MATVWLSVACGAVCISNWVALVRDDDDAFKIRERVDFASESELRGRSVSAGECSV